MGLNDANVMKNRTIYESGTGLVDDGNTYAATDWAQYGAADWELDLGHVQEETWPELVFSISIGDVESDTGDETYSIEVHEGDATGLATVLRKTIKVIDKALGSTTANPTVYSFKIQPEHRFIRVKYTIGGTIATGLEIIHGVVSPSGHG